MLIKYVVDAKKSLLNYLMIVIKTLFTAAMWNAWSHDLVFPVKQQINRPQAHNFICLSDLVVTHSANRVNGTGLIPWSLEHIWDLILVTLHWQASTVGYALYVFKKLWSHNAV